MFYEILVAVWTMQNFSFSFLCSFQTWCCTVLSLPFFSGILCPHEVENNSEGSDVHLQCWTEKCSTDWDYMTQKYLEVSSVVSSVCLFCTKFCGVSHLCRNVVPAHSGRTGNRFFVIHNLVHDINKWSIYTNWHITFKYRQSFVNHFNRKKGSDVKDWL
jgi:hypothetical protein